MNYNGNFSEETLEKLIVVVGGYIKDFEKAENYPVKKIVSYYKRLGSYLEVRYGN